MLFRSSPGPLIIALLGAGLLMASGCNKKPTTGEKGQDGTPREKAGRQTNNAPARADFTLTAAQFVEEFKKDRQAAQKKYEGMTVELSGKVQLLSGGGRPSLTLNLKGALVGVQCFTTDPQPWARVSPGQEVKVRGKFPEGSPVAALIDCTVEPVGKNSAPSVSAGQLAREYGADPPAAAKKYENKYLIVTGKVVALKPNDLAGMAATLEGDGKVQVVCRFTAFDKDQTAALKVGQPIKVLGQCSPQLAKDVVVFNFCLLIRTAE